MNQPGFFVPIERQKMSFPPQMNNQYVQNQFAPLMPFNNYPQNPKIKFQNPQYNYSYYDYENKRKQQNNHNDNSPQYDLFQIQKKRKKQKYKRSTNNSHKKFISAIRRLFYAVISTKEKDQFQIKYSKFRSCRTFFFIILAYMKYRFSEKLLNSVRVSFINQMKIKINEYQEQCQRTKNMNLKNFREEQIIDIKYSIKSCNEYFNGNTREAIESMYKKDKSTVIKRQHYESALRSVHMIEKELKQTPRSLLEQPYVEDYSPSSDRQKIEKKVLKREIRQNHKYGFDQEDDFNFGNSFQKMEFNYNKKELRPTNDTDQAGSQDHLQNEVLPEKEFLCPPILEPVPYVKYDPFLPPFKYRKETKIRYDVKEDFFGYLNFGFPKFYDRSLDFFGMPMGRPNLPQC